MTSSEKSPKLRQVLTLLDSTMINVGTINEAGLILLGLSGILFGET